MLPKTAHAEFLMERHDDIRPEWVMRIIEDPYDQWVETDNHGRTSQVIAGRIEGASQWIRVVLNLDGSWSPPISTTDWQQSLEDDRGRKTSESRIGLAEY